MASTDKIKANQDQYNLDRQSAKIPEVAEKFKFEYSPLGEELNNKTKSNNRKTEKTNKGDKNVIYNSR